MEIELRLHDASSLKEKRQVVRHLVEASRRRFGVSASEGDHHDSHRLPTLAFAAVAPSPARAEELLDRVERFVWSHMELEVLSARRRWLEDD